MGRRFTETATCTCGAVTTTAAAMIVLALPTLAAAGRYEIKDLGVNIVPEALNNSAQIVALTPPVFDDFGQHLATPGTLYRIDPDGTRITIATGDVLGRDINNRGEVTAIVLGSPSRFDHISPLRTDAAGRVVPFLPGINASIGGINDAGDIVGVEIVDATTSPQKTLPFRIDAAGRRTNFPSFQSIDDINNRGDVVVENY